MATHVIWDPFVRVFHWSLAGLFAANALIVDDDSWTHQWIGYAVAALVVLRILWGLAGPRRARLASVIPWPRAVTRQITDIATRRRRAHPGQTPLGAVMIFNLILPMLAICASGYMMTRDAFRGIEWVEELHEALVTWAEISILVHIAAVLFESARTGINLPRAMITGTKHVPDDIEIVE